MKPQPTFRQRLLTYLMALPALIIFLLLVRGFLENDLRESAPQGQTNRERPRYCVQSETPVYLYPVPETEITAHLAAGEEVYLTLYVTNGWLEVGHAHGRGFVPRQSVAECDTGG